MKKWTALFLTIILILSMVGCSGVETKQNATEDSVKTNATANQEESLTQTDSSSNNNTSSTQPTSIANSSNSFSSSTSSGGNVGNASSSNKTNSSVSGYNANGGTNSSANNGASSKPVSNGTTNSSVSSTTQVNYGTFEMKILKIGASDAIILKSSTGKTVLIDAGSESDSDAILKYLSQKGISYVDYFIVTHFDNDHIGGAPKVIQGINIGTVIQPSYDRSGNKTYTLYANALAAKGIAPKSISSTYSFSLGNVDCKIYTAQKSSYTETKDNDFSLVARFVHGENSFLFTGDIMSERIAELLNTSGLQSDFVLLPRHGQYENNLQQFINMVKPTYAAITCSDKKPEDSRVTQFAKNVGATVYLTRNGYINAVSNGKKLTVSITAA